MNALLFHIAHSPAYPSSGSTLEAEITFGLAFGPHELLLGICFRGEDGSSNLRPSVAFASHTDSWRRSATSPVLQWIHHASPRFYMWLIRSGWFGSHISELPGQVVRGCGILAQFVLQWGSSM